MASPQSEKKIRGPYRNNRRDLVVKEAMALFAHNGYDGVTHEMIAERAGVSKGAINKLFGNKEALATLCAERFVDYFAAEVHRVIELGLPYAQHIEQVAELFRQHADSLRFLLGLVVTPKNAHMAKNLWSATFAEKSAPLVQYQQEVQPGDMEDLLYIMSALHFSYVLGGNRERYDSARAAMLRHFLLPQAGDVRQDEDAPQGDKRSP